MSRTAAATAPSTLLRGTLAVVVSACCFGSISPLTVVATEHGMALQSLQAWRYLTTAVLLVSAARLMRVNDSAAATDSAARADVAPWYTPRVLLVAGGGQAAVATLALLALRWLPAATASFLFYTYPAWVAILTAVRGIEPLETRRITALVIALVGIAAMVGAPDTSALSPIGVGVILAAAIVYALYIPVLSQLQQHRNAMDVSRAIGVGGAAIFCTWALATGTLFTIPDATAFGASVLQGVLSAGSFLGFLAGLRVLGPVRTAITSTVEPFWTTMLGVVLLGQAIGPGTVVGGLAIMVAVILLQRR